MIGMRVRAFQEVVGCCYYPAATDLAAGQPVDLVREPDNQHDENAIRVESAQGQVGHLSKHLAAMFAPLLDRQCVRLSATIAAGANETSRKPIEVRVATLVGQHDVPQDVQTNWNWLQRIAGRDEEAAAAPATGANHQGNAWNTGADGACSLLSLSPDLMARVWPVDRVLEGRMVCQHLRSLLPHAFPLISLVMKSLAIPEANDIQRSLKDWQPEVALKWQGSIHGLVPVAALRLVRLDFRGSGVNFSHTHSIDALATVLRECKELAHLDLSGTKTREDGTARLAEMLGECRVLAHLALACNAISARGVGRLVPALGQCQALKHLDLSDNRFENEGMELLAVGLGACTALAHLDVSENLIAGQALGQLGEFKALAHLNLSKNLLSNDGAEELASGLGLCMGLTHLDLSRCRLEQQGGQRVLEALRNCTALTHLALRKAMLDGDGWFGAERLAGVLGQCKALTSLDVSSTQIGAHMARVTRGLKECTALTRLDLGHNQIDGSGEQVVTELWECKALAHLSLQSTGIGANVAGLARGLRGFLALTRLDLCDNKIDDEGARAVSDLWECKALAHVNLDGNRFSRQSAELLKVVLGSAMQVELLNPDIHA